MATTFEQSRDLVADLVKHFSKNRTAFMHPSYKEAHARHEFIDPLFAALGWDVTNAQHVAPDYREVVVEDSLDVEGQMKAPDYVFRVGRERKFFAEAKKPGVDLKTSAAPAYQLRRYAWSAKLPVSVLTDFDEFSVYDCRLRPKDGDKPSVARINYLTHDLYVDRWREIYDLFSREAVWSGEFDKYSQKGKGKGTTEVDAEFLKEIEGWRDVLARNIALRNPSLTIDELNDSVQRIIDRIIFLRMAEDRGIEEYGLLQTMAKGENVYAKLLALSMLADARYNSGLFDFSKTGDAVTPKLKIDDKALKPILSDLYFPKSPYEFSVLPAEILGNVYEQFLGKVIRLTAGHQAKVEEKPEVKKAGGVYYTPSYIVEYIVKNTVGKQIEGKSPKQLLGFRVLDMACGSGSFLLGAFQHLLDYYREWYSAHNPEKHSKELWQHKDAWRLTTAEKKRILTEHIFGVDIDRQAVEVTKLSLLLKVLEGENEETLGKQLTFSLERVLPNLDRNIKCGNSLIGPDYFTGQLLPDPEELRRVNPFDWNAEFPEAMKAGGFDCVIGNPPYIRIQNLKEWAPLEVEAYKELYQSASVGNYDIYVVFIEKGICLINSTGKIGYILPNKFFQNQYGKNIRSIISSSSLLQEIVHFGSSQIFVGATTYTCLLFLGKSPNSFFSLTHISDVYNWRAGIPQPTRNIPIQAASSSEWNFSSEALDAIFRKMRDCSCVLASISDRIFQGIIPGADKVYAVKLLRTTRNISTCYSYATEHEFEIETSLLRQIVSGAHVKRYSVLHSDTRVIYPYFIDADGNCHLMSTTLLSRDFPLAFKYFLETRSLLDSRDRGSAKGQEWYRYIRTQNIALQIKPKLLVPRLVSRLSCGYDPSGVFCLDNVDVGGILLLDTPGVSPYFIIGLLNSKLLDAYFKSHSVPFRGNYYSGNRQYIEHLPIRIIHDTILHEKTARDKIAILAKSMIDLHESFVERKDHSELERLQRMIESTDRQIDALVYDLYGLTEQEIDVIESRST